MRNNSTSPGTPFAVLTSQITGFQEAAAGTSLPNPWQEGFICKKGAGTRSQRKRCNGPRAHTVTGEFLLVS